MDLNNPTNDSITMSTNSSVSSSTAPSTPQRSTEKLTKAERRALKASHSSSQSPSSQLSSGQALAPSDIATNPSSNPSSPVSKRSQQNETPPRPTPVLASTLQAHGSLSIQVFLDPLLSTIQTVPNCPPSVRNNFITFSANLNLLEPPDWSCLTQHGYQGIFHAVGLGLQSNLLSDSLANFFTDLPSTASSKQDRIQLVTQARTNFTSNHFKKSDDPQTFSFCVLHNYMLRIFDHFIDALNKFDSYNGIPLADREHYGIADGTPFPHYYLPGVQVQMLIDIFSAFGCPMLFGLIADPQLIKLLPSQRSESHASDVLCSGSWDFENMSPTVTHSDIRSLISPSPLLAFSPDLKSFILYHSDTLCKSNLDSDAAWVYAQFYSDGLLAPDPIPCSAVQIVVEALSNYQDIWDSPPNMDDVIYHIVTDKLLNLPLNANPPPPQGTEDDPLEGQPSQITVDTFPEAMAAQLNPYPYDDFLTSLHTALWTQHVVHLLGWTSPRNLSPPEPSRLPPPRLPSGTLQVQDTGHSVRLLYQDPSGSYRVQITRHGADSDSFPLRTQSWIGMHIFTGFLQGLQNHGVPRPRDFCDLDLSSGDPDSQRFRMAMFRESKTLRDHTRPPGSFHFTKDLYDLLIKQFQRVRTDPSGLPQSPQELTMANLLEHLKGLLMTILTPHGLERYQLLTRLSADVDVLLTASFTTPTSASEVIHSWHLRTDPLRCSHSSYPSTRPPRTDGSYCIEITLSPNTTSGLDCWFHMGAQRQGLQASSIHTPPGAPTPGVPPPTSHHHVPMASSDIAAGCIISGIPSLLSPDTALSRLEFGLFQLGLRSLVDMDQLLTGALGSRPPDPHRHRSVQYSAIAPLPRE